MAHKTKQETTIPDGTMQQRVQISKLRGEIALLNSIRELDRFSVTAVVLQDEEAYSINRMEILLQDAYNLKFLLCDPSPEIKEKLGSIDISEVPATPESLSKKMAAVSEVKLAGDPVLLELLKRGIELRENLLRTTMRTLGKRTPDQETTYELVSMAYQLTLLKSFASNPSVGKQWMKEFYLESSRMAAGLKSASSRYEFIEKLVQYKITASGEERASNIKEGLSSLSSLFASAEGKTAEISGQLDEISKNEARLLRILSTSQSKEMIESMGISRGFNEDANERLETHIPALDTLIKKKGNRLRSVVESIASQSKETGIREFSGLGKKRLRHLAGFWEDLEEHTLAPWRLAHIYAELGEWAKAKKWLEEYIDRNFSKLDYDGITQSLKFGLNLSSLSGDKEWNESLGKRLAAHLSVPNYQFLSEAIRKREEDPGSDGVLDGYS